MTQVGEGRETEADEAGPVMTFGTPTVGEILAERYQLEEHVNDDSAGRQVWRGSDVILRRPVAVVLRRPGGDSATEMLQAAVDASRVIHPNLVGVYDAIDEGGRAYVVREWVDGVALREMVGTDGPMDAARATAIARALADALAAVHATGMVHGNVHPGTTLIGDDGRVVLADARADSADSTETDVRKVGGVLYYALTGRWPHQEAGRSALPDANRDAAGNLTTPRQMRAGVPAYLDDLTMDLLDQRVAAPEADALAAELARLDAADDYEDVGPLRFTESNAVEPVRSTRKIVLGVGALVVIAVVGLVFGIRAITNSGQASPTETTQANTAPAGAGTSGDSQQQKDGGPTDSPTPKNIPLTGDMVRIVDPPQGTRADTGEATNTVDGDGDTAWKTQRFKQSNFGNQKAGMGVLINLGTPRTIADLSVETSAPGVTMQIMWGPDDPGDNTEGDDQIVKTYKKLGDPVTTDGTQKVFTVFDDAQKYQYVLVFLTDLPEADDGRGGYRVDINKISVEGY
ncbi:protein kinase family protein [Mangrovihabitans endophyticus]|uniref:Membrane protein n=1 Tax=Mangrovihabitans endophyticus TaxID=1751298 RepID=A0A8J3C0K6_9ACTN|nr:protein kinase family protein [Mangrovihabitans endophyticus]GGK93402.1 membrane protein [Mangrovihabitans endophyticus]